MLLERVLSRVKIEKKLKAMEEERPDAMEMAKEKNEERKKEEG
jgi:hypothetical protein